MKGTHLWSLATLITAVVLSVPVAGGARAPVQPVPPDFTKGERVSGDNNTLALGATGAYGEIWST